MIYNLLEMLLITLEKILLFVCSLLWWWIQSSRNTSISFQNNLYCRLIKNIRTMHYFHTIGPITRDCQSIVSVFCSKWWQFYFTSEYRLNVILEYQKSVQKCTMSLPFLHADCTLSFSAAFHCLVVTNTVISTFTSINMPCIAFPTT